MMNFKKLLSLFLALLMMAGVMTSYSVITVSAAEVSEETTGDEDVVAIEDYLTTLYASPEDKLATMKLMTTKGNYAIYADAKSGEVAVKDLTTGQILFTNPYDIGATTASDSVKQQILSQIIVKFTENGRDREYTSYEYAAVRDQIKVKNIKNGIRVEYTIGREEARRLVPRQIEKERFLTMIQTPMEEYYGVAYEDAKKFKDETGHPLQSASFYLCKQMSYFVYKSLDECSSDRLKEDLLATFPIVNKMDIYVLDPTATITEIEKIEEVIKTACPNYSYEEMDHDHQLTEYTSDEENPPVFKMALEYTIDADGFTVRMPANGIRFNESKFQLTDVSILPYMGAGNNAYDGYTFYPDGSGALFSFEDLADQGTYAVSGKIYGSDYAYHKLTAKYQQTIRYPVFGIVESTRYYDCHAFDEETGENTTTRVSGVIYDAVMKAQEEGNSASPIYKAYNSLLSSADIEEVVVDRGYVAIIEEGDALTELTNYHAGVLSPYDTIQMEFNPRPQDSYNIADSISVGSNSEWTVVSNRKYVGNYKIHYVMLADKDEAANKELKADQWYEASWLGMAFAYRDYLTDRGLLNALTAEDINEDIPLYIESFGAVETVEKFLSIPVEMMKPLTSAEDIITMYEELADQGATNINFKLTGYANGGLLYNTMPYNLKWEKAIGEEVSMEELFAYAAGVEDGQMGLYPEFDFSYVVNTKMFDGFRMRKHAVRTIDDRYSFEREYIATQQKHFGFLKMAISPAYFAHFYEKFMEEYLAYDHVNGLSVGSFGHALNSDFDEDEPYNREDAKGFVVQALQFISGTNDGNMNVMVEGGNAYTWQYVDHLLGAALDSSRYIKASYSVPFVGVVLHGSMNFTGSPLNMEGDINYAKLKAIENGAAPYFTLSYQNTQLLKEDVNLSQYYSIRYDIWFDDVVEMYNELNSVLADVQDKYIADHQFLVGLRVPDTDELDRDITSEFESVLDFQNNKAEYEEKLKAESVADARDKIASVEVAAESFVKDCLTYYSGISGAAYMYVTGERSFERRLATYVEAQSAYAKVKAEYDAAEGDEKAAIAPLLSNAEASQKQALGQLKTYIRNVGRAIDTIETSYTALSKLLEEAKSGALLINATDGCPQSIVEEIAIQLQNTENFMAEQLGVRFDMTVDKAEVDTFIYTHISTLVFSCYGTANHTHAGIVGKAENIFNMLNNNDYGLLMSELELLRYLEANRDLTDAQLIDKYGLSETKSSVDGLVKYLLELLGENYEFDPLVANQTNGVEDNVRDYFESLLYVQIGNIGHNSMVPVLNFVPTRVNEKGRIVPNTTNINAVTKLIDTEINKLVKGVLDQVADGNYKLSDYTTADEINALVATITEIITKNVRTPENPSPTNPVEYATPDTLEADIRNYIESSYYKTAIAEITPTTAGDIKLQVLTVSTRTKSTIDMLVTRSLSTYVYGEDTKYEDIVKAIWADTVLTGMLNSINDTVKGAYGDVYDKLEKAFLAAYAKAALGKDKAPTLENASYTDAEDNKIRLRDEAAALLEKMTVSYTEAEVNALIAEIVALHDKYTESLDEGYDPTADVTNYVYYNLMALMRDQVLNENDNYYYDAQMAKLDASIRNSVAEKAAEILASMPAEYTTFQLMDKVFAALAAGNEVSDFVEKAAAEVTHTADGKYNLESDALAYYTYLLVNAFEGYSMTEKPTITVSGGSSKVTNALKIVDADLEDRIPLLMAQARSKTERGQTHNYALDAFLTEDEITDIANELVSALIKALFATEAERETLVPELIEYLKYSYYSAVREKLGAATLPSFHVSEIYGGTLHEASTGLKELMYYYVTAATGMSEAEIDALIGKKLTEKDTDEDEEASRYVSDDGRIVSVTYGTKNADGSYTAYKTFILNYNNFSVNVEYGPENEKVTYTIPAYGYVVVMQ